MVRTRTTPRFQKSGEVNLTCGHTSFKEMSLVTELENITCLFLIFVNRLENICNIHLNVVLFITIAYNLSRTAHTPQFFQFSYSFLPFLLQRGPAVYPAW